MNTFLLLKMIALLDFSNFAIINNTVMVSGYIIFILKIHSQATEYTHF